MGATLRPRGSRFIVTVHSHGQRTAKVVKDRHTAKALVAHIHKLEAQGQNVVGAIQQARSTPIANGHPTLKAALGGWLDAQERGGEIRASTADTYRKSVKVWLYPHAVDGRRLGDLPVNAITREHLGSALSAAKAAGKSRAVLAHVRHPVVGLFRDFVERKVLPGPSPASDLAYFIGRNRRGKSSASFFTPQEGRKLLAAAKGSWLHPFIMSGLVCGLRWGESAGLYVTDIRDDDHLHIQRTVSGQARLAGCKDGEDRIVRASPVLMKALRAHIKARTVDSPLVFPTKNGTPLRYSYFIRRWKDLLAAAKLEYRKYHSTRHSCASWLLEAGTDIRYVSRMLGHSSLALTADIYGRHMLMASQHERAVDALDKHLS